MKNFQNNVNKLENPGFDSRKLKKFGYNDILSLVPLSDKKVRIRPKNLLTFKENEQLDGQKYEVFEQFEVIQLENEQIKSQKDESKERLEVEKSSFPVNYVFGQSLADSEKEQLKISLEQKRKTMPAKTCFSCGISVCNIKD